ncbi:hypothetical protein [Antribacter gilvus]|uniref:hypothetical protein n=1 Tax=Antribacter gilvus TaxID=2304675 RepID=UPI000F790993|nr:hypothetical protein [Antribacter gilvus]
MTAQVVAARPRPMLSLARRLDQALLAPATPHALVRLRTLLALVMGLQLATTDWAPIAARPAELTYRLWVLGWLPAPVPEPVLLLLEVAGLAGVALVLARRWPRAGFALAWACYLVLAGLWGASGKFMHNDLLPLTVAFPLLFAPAVPEGAGRDTRWGWPPRAALIVLATVYFLTGAQKLRHSGLEWAFGENMAWVLRQGRSPFGPGLTHFLADTPLLPQLLASGALALELGALVLLALRRTRVPFAVAATAMHLSIWACLGLDYSPWWLTAWAVALATGPVLQQGGKPGGWRRRAADVPAGGAAWAGAPAAPGAPGGAA